MSHHTEHSEEADRLDTVFAAATVLFWLFVVGYALTVFIPRRQYGILFLGGMIGLYLLNEFIDSFRAGERLDVSLLALVAAITLATTAYVGYNYELLITTRSGYAYAHEYALAGVFVFSVLYLTYRRFDISFLGVVVAAILYGYLGPYFPGILAHGGYSTTRLLNMLVLDVRGFYGNLTEIVAAWIALFLLYAGLLKAYGAFDLIIRVAFRAATYVHSGVAQSAVIASTVIGSVNGSQAANAAMTGSFTIPLMKRSGLRAETAGGIESVASTGGQILPPVMGAAAFVMASILGLQYVDVVVAGILPAVIFLVSVAVAVHYTCLQQLDAARFDVTEQIDESKPRGELVAEGIKFSIPLFVLIYLLGVAQWTITTSALVTCAAMFATGLGVPVLYNAITRAESASELALRLGRETVEGCRYGAVTLAPIAIIVAAINGVVDIFLSTGVPGLISLTIIDLSGGVMAVAIALAMVVCIILGLGMPTVAAYTLVALLIAPSLVNNFQIPDLAAHYFVFYAAILSGLTPPIAVGVVVATGIAESNFWRTCEEALKIAAPLYVLPIAFIYNPEIVVGGLTAFSLASAGLALGGAIVIVHALNYPPLVSRGRAVRYASRLLLFSLGFVVMVYPGEGVRAAIAALSIGYITLQVRGIIGETTVRTDSSERI